MRKKIQSLLISSIFVLGLAAPLALASSTAPVAAQTGSTILDGLDSGSRATDPEADNLEDAEGRVEGIIALVINIFSLVVGVISVIMIIIGGLKYITSAGDSGNVTSAKNTILYAVIGLVIVALAQLIVRFVIQRVVDPAG